MPPKTKQKPQKPNEQCACGSGKKYKKCCSFALAVANAKPATRKAWAWRGEPEDANRLDQRIKHGAALRDSGNLQSGKTVLEAAVAYAKEIGHTQGQSAALGSLGKTCYLLGDYTKAIEHHESALAISVAIGDRKGESCDLGHLGASYNKLEQWTEAIEYLEKALQISNEVRQQLALTTLGLLYLSA